jgi:hypothetical protein
LLDSESFQKAAERGLALMEKETKSSPRTSTRCFVRALALPGAVLNQLSEPAASKLNSEVLYPVNQQSRSQILRAYPTFLCLCLGEGPMVYSYICLPPAD